MAMGLGADVTIMDRSPTRLRWLDDYFQGRVKILFSTLESLQFQIAQADLVIGAVLIPGASAPKLVNENQLSLMQQGSVLVDVAIDQGGCFETSRPTSHQVPTYQVNGIVHYCVANIPGAVPRTSTMALTNVTLPYVIRLANEGVNKALMSDPLFCNGLNVYKGHVAHAAVAEALGEKFTDPKNLLV